MPHIELSQKQIADAFSTGDFELVYPCLSDKVVWVVVGENKFVGKEEVINNCEQTARYFKSVTTNFKTINSIAGENRVAVNGTAEFLRDNTRIAFVSACDVFEFDNNNMLESITSYCISEK